MGTDIRGLNWYGASFQALRPCVSRPTPPQQRAAAQTLFQARPQVQSRPPGMRGIWVVRQNDGSLSATARVQHQAGQRGHGVSAFRRSCAPARSPVAVLDAGQADLDARRPAASAGVEAPLAPGSRFPGFHTAVAGAAVDYPRAGACLGALADVCVCPRSMSNSVSAASTRSLPCLMPSSNWRLLSSSDWPALP